MRRSYIVRWVLVGIRLTVLYYIWRRMVSLSSFYSAAEHFSVDSIL